MNRERSLRKALVDGLKRRHAFRSKSVERAFRAVPRHLFVPNVPPEQAYQDQVVVVKTDAEGIPISSSSQPTMMAIMLEQLGLQAGMHVLEIGAGSGYNAALMAHIVGNRGRVVSIDIDDDLVNDARAHIASAGYDHNVTVVRRDGVEGYAEGAPYDRIILTAAGWDISPAWHQQLKADGIIVMPIVTNQVQFSVAFKREGDIYTGQSVMRCRFMPMRGELPGRNNPITIQLAPEVSMTMSTINDHAPDVDAATLTQWLQNPIEEANSGITLKAADLHAWNFVDLTADAQGLHNCVFYAGGEAVTTELFPYLAGAQSTMRYSVGVISENGMIVLMRPPGTFFPEKPDTDPFPLWVRMYGEDGRELARRYVAIIKAWEQAGRPDESQLSIKLVPNNIKIDSHNNIIIPKKWNQLVLAWS